MNYPDLLRGFAPSLRSRIPVSSLELAPEGTASRRTGFFCGPSEPLVLRTVPDSTGVSLAGRFGVDHSYRPDTPTTTDDARSLSRLNKAGTVVCALFERDVAASRTGGRSRRGFRRCDVQRLRHSLTPCVRDLGIREFREIVLMCAVYNIKRATKR